MQKIYELELDNNRMLHAMRRSSMFGTFFRFVWWAVLIGGSVWAYYTYLGPLLQETLAKVDQVQGSLQAVQSVGADLSAQTGDINAVIEKVRAFIPGIPNIPAAQ